MTKQIIILFSFLITLFAFTEDAPPQLKHTSHRAFQGGEKLTYSVAFGIFTAGIAYITVRDTTLENKTVMHLKMEGITTGLADMIYKVRDSYESYTDTATDMPVKAVRNIREGGYKYYNEVTYNRDSSTVTSKRSGVKAVPENTMDILSAFFYGRNHYFNDNLKEGEIISFITYFSDKEFPLKIKYEGIEVIRTPIGKVECYKFAPITEVGRSFESNEDMHLWISRDDNRLPVKIKFELLVGSFTCTIHNFSGLKYPFTSLKPKR
jgi:hypothetical protein